MEYAADGPRILDCKTYETTNVDLRLLTNDQGALDLREDVADRGYFSVHLGDRDLKVQVGGYIGFIPLNDRLVMRVQPRMPVANLTHIIAVSGEEPRILSALREYGSSDLPWTEYLADLYTEALLRELDTVHDRGIYRSYERRDEVSSYPRGRVLVHPTLQRLRPRGINHAAHTAWYVRTVDTPANQCLKYAIWSLSRAYAGRAPHRHTRELLRRLNGAYSLFEAVALDHQMTFLRDSEVQGRRSLPALRSYYRSALDVAIMAIERRSLRVETLLAGGIRLPSLVTDLNRVVERYLREVLSARAFAREWDVVVLDGHGHSTPLFRDREGGPRAEPDIVIERLDGSVPLVGEVKNVPLDSPFSKRAAIEQAVTYAVVYGIKQVLLVHPTSGSDAEFTGLSTMGSIGDITVYQYRFDFGADPITEEDERFSQAIETLVPDLVAADAHPVYA